jgi:hypothetical protein
MTIIKYGGGPNPPVRLDKWQNIVNVGWGDGDGFGDYIYIQVSIYLRDTSLSDQDARDACALEYNEAPLGPKDGWYDDGEPRSQFWTDTLEWGRLQPGQDEPFGDDQINYGFWTGSFWSFPTSTVANPLPVSFAEQSLVPWTSVTPEIEIIREDGEDYPDGGFLNPDRSTPGADEYFIKDATLTLGARTRGFAEGPACNYVEGGTPIFNPTVNYAARIEPVSNADFRLRDADQTAAFEYLGTVIELPSGRYVATGIARVTNPKGNSNFNYRLVRVNILFEREPEEESA